MPAHRADQPTPPPGSGDTPQTARQLSWQVPDDVTFGHECAWPFLGMHGQASVGEQDTPRAGLLG